MACPQLGAVYVVQAQYSGLLDMSDVSLRTTCISMSACHVAFAVDYHQDDRLTQLVKSVSHLRAACHVCLTQRVFSDTRCLQCHNGLHQ